MKTWQTCLFWSLPEEDPAETHRACLNQKIGFAPGELDPAQDDWAFVWSDEPMMTGPKFGCIHYEMHPDLLANN